MAFNINALLAQQIVETVKDVCAQDINFIDTHGIICASTNARRIGDFHEIGLRVVKTGETIEVDTDFGFQGTQKGVNIPVFFNGDVNGVIGISGAPDEVRKYAYLAQKITALIIREHELEFHEHNAKTQLNHIMRSIVFREYINPEHLKSFFKKYSVNPDTCYQTIVIKLDSEHTSSSLSVIEQNIYQAFEVTSSPLYTFNYPNEYILFIEAEKLPKWLYVFEKLSCKNAPLLKIGVGHSVPLSRQHISYQSAIIAINSLFSEEYLAIFDSLDLEILFGNADKDSKKFFLDKTVSVLTAKERELLKTYFSTNMSLKKTSDLLFLHKNTLQYQLDKIARTTGYNPRDFKEAAVLYIGLKLSANEDGKH